MARGDRKVADAIETAYKMGALYDAWGETFHYEIWTAAFEKCGLSIDFYNTRERSLDEVFPWDFIDTCLLYTSCRALVLTLLIQ